MPERSEDDVRVLCVTMVLFANVSFRATPRILAHFFASGQWIPHFTSAINWTLRIGLGLLAQAAPISDAWIAIVDHSIDLGVKKTLVVLRVRAALLSEKGSALSLADCECIGIDVNERTDGETVARGLKEIFDKCGEPIAILKDRGSDLNRGVELWKERSQSPAEIIDDIGHVAANALKAEYATRRPFKAFLALCARASRLLRQTELAFLVPPKLRSKGRFQGILPLAEWARKVMAALDAAHGDPEYAKLRKAFVGLSKSRDMIAKFARRVIEVNAILKILKNEGLNQATYERCKEHMEWLVPASPLERRLSAWFQRHLAIQKRLGLDTLPVSSDVIESLFGKFKAMQGRGTVIDMNRSVLLIPALCGAGGADAFAQALSQTSQRKLRDWDQTNIPYTQNGKRRDFLRRGLPAPAMGTGKSNLQAG